MPLWNNSYFSSTTNQVVLRERGYAFLFQSYLLKLQILLNIKFINIFQYLCSFQSFSEQNHKLSQFSYAFLSRIPKLCTLLILALKEFFPDLVILCTEQEKVLLCQYDSVIFSHTHLMECAELPNYFMLGLWKVFTGLLIKFGEHSSNGCHIDFWKAVIKFFNNKKFTFPVVHYLH